jgi:protocatechuate 3,4-dioxygenase beta subunit/peroxiredoxin
MSCRKKPAIPILFAVTLAVLLTSPALSADDVEIAGRIVDKSGNPVPGASFAVVTMSTEMMWQFEVAAATTADEDGRFSLARDEIKTQSSFSLYVAGKPGYGAAWVFGPGAVRSGKTPGDLELTLPPAGTVGGKVVDGDGRAISHARISAFITLTDPAISEEARFLPPCEAWLSAGSGSDGAFLLEGLPKDATVILRANHPDFAVTLAGAPESMQGLPMGTIAVGAADVVITLEPGASIEGKVTLEDSGKPVEGVVVAATPAARNILEILSGVRRAETNADGSYTLSGLAASQYSVKASHPDWTAASLSVDLSEGGLVGGHDITLVKGVLLSGRFITAGTGKPVAEAYMSVMHVHDGTPVPQTARQIEVKEDGTFEFRYPPGEIRLDAHTPSGTIASGQRQRNLTLVAGEDQTDVVFEVEPPLMFKGKVLDPDGEPVAGAQVKRHMSAPSSSKTAEDGTFEIPLPNQRFGEDEWVMLMATHPDLPGHRGILSQTLPDESAAEGTITLRPTGTVRGRVLGEDGKPIPSAKVVTWLCFDRRSTTDVRIAADEAGKYEISDAAGGMTLRVQASAEGYGEDRTEEFFMEEDGAYDAPDLVLAVADKVIEGTVVDEDGKPLANVHVSGNGPGTGHRSVQSDAKGRFKVDKLVDEEFRLHAYHQGADGTLRANIQVMAGETEVELVLAKEVRQATPEELQAKLLARKAAPELEVTAWVAGNAATLESLRGKPIVLAFWDSTDDSDAEVISALKALHETHADGGVAVIAVHASGVDEAALKRRFADDPVAFRVALDKAASAKDAGATFKKYKVRKPPAIFVIDADGVVQYQDIPLAAASRALEALQGDK